MTTQEFASIGRAQDFSTFTKGQYSLWQIIGIWLAAGVPMWLLGWVVYPMLSGSLAPLDAGLLRMKLFTGGMTWQFVLAMIIVYREMGTISLGTIRRRFWLNHPRDVRSGETRKALWGWLIPLIVIYAALEIGLRSLLVEVWTGIFPFLAEPESLDFTLLLSPELHAFWVSNWGMMVLFFVSALFNTFLGEEFIFRGVLLPRMEGIFGKWDWVANGVLFSLYHLHQPWGILATLPGDLVIAFSGKRFRSNWFPILIHSGQSVFFLGMILGLVLGWMG